MIPLHVAAGRGHCEKILEILIAKGGDESINITDEDGVSMVTYVTTLLRID